MSHEKQREKLKRVNFSLTPSVRQEFEKTAKTLGMSLTEYLSRAGFAAKAGPLNRKQKNRT